MIKNWLLIGLLCLNSSLALCQTKKRLVDLKIISFHDTIVNIVTSLVKIKLTNNSDTSILLSGRFSHPYGKAIYIDKCRTDTIDQNEVESRVDANYLIPDEFKNLKPGESKIFYCNLFCHLEEGKVKVKFYFDIEILNGTFDKAETDWINQYYNANFKRESSEESKQIKEAKNWIELDSKN